MNKKMNTYFHLLLLIQALPQPEPEPVALLKVLKVLILFMLIMDGLKITKDTRQSKN